ncbi:MULTISPECIES: glycosyltransferase [unclassified Marinimicrobium]|uniref:glycosyltransferase n=1 Tax=unclassified Marinimicrobium TaxID=2632100 RepID=UPI000C45FAF0|nr:MULTISPECIES: glycosyltransferase [unclassified Marinimicrobium]MAN52486.1 glycosyltransferase [Marinimicrobium sp.]
MPHLIVLGSVWPEPKSSAAGTRMVQLLEEFQRADWRITFASAALPSQHRLDLPARGIAEAAVELNADSFDRWLVEQAPDAVLFDRFMTEEQFGWRVERTCPSAVRLLDTEDLHSLRAARWARLKRRQSLAGSEAERQSVRPETAAPDELFQEMADSDLLQRELAAIYRCDLSLMISEFEMQLLTDTFEVPPSLLIYLPLWASSEPNPLPFESREHFVSIGNFRHAPNWDAVLWLKHDLWPRIRAALPETELHLYGAYPPPKATALNNPRQGFRVLGWAEDAREVMGRARVCLAPLRFGAGIKGKLLDAMVCGTPSVTTSVGAEAMADQNQWPGVVADDADALLEAAVSLYQDKTRWQSAQIQSRTTLAQRFSPQRFEGVLLDRLRTLQTTLVDHRRRNIVGTMLRHHQHRSTQYMSQWIEAKNRLAARDDSHNSP